jgi:hypothetical protein
MRHERTNNETCSRYRISSVQRNRVARRLLGYDRTIRGGCSRRSGENRPNLPDSASVGSYEALTSNSDPVALG